MQIKIFCSNLCWTPKDAIHDVERQQEDFMEHRGVQYERGVSTETHIKQFNNQFVATLTITYS